MTLSSATLFAILTQTLFLEWLPDIAYDFGDEISMFEDHYIPWRESRFNYIVKHYGVDFFKGKTLLELGCGYADLGAMFLPLGACVTSVDGREEHIEIVKKVHPEILAMVADLDGPWPFVGQRFDLILHTGLLYHLRDYKKSILESISSTDHLILETEVSDSKSDDFSPVQHEDGYDQALSGFGCRPSARSVERVLSENGVKYERRDTGELNGGPHNYDWEEKFDDSQTVFKRRFWFVWR